MPFLTRDFAVFLGVVTFLLGGIFVTVSENYFAGGQQAAVVEFGEGIPVDYKVAEPEVRTMDRTTTLTNLRSKVAKYMKTVVVEKEPEEVVEVASEEPGEVADTPGVMLCPNYLAYNKAWDPQGLQFEVVEGARLVFRPLVNTVIEPLATGTVAMPARDIVVQLPLRTFPSKQKSCLPTDVIGIATDGSLIRNSEVGLYSVFGATTLVGYSLDGFGIYGAGEIGLDTCGGKVVAGEYRYYLDKEREGVINCYAGVPTTL